MKRTPLVRKTPLRAKRPERVPVNPPGMRWTGLRWVPADGKTGLSLNSGKTGKRSKADPPELREAKDQRRTISRDVCEVDGCGQPAVHFHHRWMRSQGGVHAWWNLLHSCLSCHEHIHANPEDSYRKGYLLRRTDGLAEQERRAAELARLIEEAS